MLDPIQVHARDFCLFFGGGTADPLSLSAFGPGAVVAEKCRSVVKRRWRFGAIEWEFGARWALPFRRAARAAAGLGFRV